MPRKKVVNNEITGQVSIKPIMPEMVASCGFDTSSNTRTRRNAASSIVPTDQYKNISDGITPFKQSNSHYNIKDAIELCQKAYWNISVFRNVIDLMCEFSLNKILLAGKNNSAKKFITAWLKRINIFGVQDKYFRERFRSGNICVDTHK